MKSPLRERSLATTTAYGSPCGGPILTAPRIGTRAPARRSAPSRKRTGVSVVSCSSSRLETCDMYDEGTLGRSIRLIFGRLRISWRGFPRLTRCGKTFDQGLGPFVHTPLFGRALHGRAD